MTEVTHGTPENPNIDPTKTKIQHSGDLGLEQPPKGPDGQPAFGTGPIQEEHLGDLAGMLARLDPKERAKVMEAAGVVFGPNDTESIEGTKTTDKPQPFPTPSEDEESHAEMRDKTKETPFWTRRKKVGTAIGAAATLLLTGAAVGVARALGNNSPAPTTQPIPSVSAPVNPTTQPSSVETSSPSPSATETETAPTTLAVKPVGKDAEKGSALFENTDAEDLNNSKLATRQVAVDWENLAIQLDPTQSVLYASGNPHDNRASASKPFDTKNGAELFTFNPGYIATTGEHESIDEKAIEAYLMDTSGQQLLDSYVSAQAVVWGQLKNPSDPNDNSLDTDKSKKSIPGLFYNPNSKEAKALANEIDKSGQAKFFTSEDRLGNVDSKSKRLLTYDVGDKRVPYVVVNYDTDNGKKHIIMTAVGTEFEGNDILDPTVSRDYKIIKPLVLEAGDGYADLEGHLNG